MSGYDVLNVVSAAVRYFDSFEVEYLIQRVSNGEVFVDTYLKKIALIDNIVVSQFRKQLKRATIPLNNINQEKMLCQRAIKY